MRYRGFAYFVLLVAILTVGYARIGTKIKMPGNGAPGIHRQSRNDIEVLEDSVFPVSLIDASGRELQLAAAPKRIVSIAPAATELLFDLGAGSSLVGDTTACDWPPQAAAVPHVGGFSDMSVESIAARNPDLIVADNTINQRLVIRLQAAHFPVLVIEPKDLDTSFDSIRMLGRATGLTVPAAALINAMKSRFGAIEKVVAVGTLRPRVLIMYDVAPIYTSGSGTLIDEMIKIAGGQNIAKSNTPIDPETAIELQPDVIICTPELQERIERLPGWKGAVPAVTNTAFFHTSAAGSLIRAGIRLATGTEELARYLHPELFTSSGKPAPHLLKSESAAGSR